MRYLYTSVLLAFLIPEAGSSAAEALLTSEGPPLVISSWSEVELMSALGVKLRTRQITEREAHRTVDVYTRLVSPSLRRIRVDDADLRQAVILLDGWRITACWRRPPSRHRGRASGNNLHLRSGYGKSWRDSRHRRALTKDHIGTANAIVAMSTRRMAWEKQA